MKSKAAFIVGKRGSGKTTASKYLERLGWTVVSAGDAIREICIDKGLPTDRDTLQNYGEYFLNKYGNKALAHKLYKQAQGNEMVIYEGIRPIKVVLILRRRYKDSIVVYIKASETNRIKRLREKYNSEFNSFNEFDNHPIEVLVDEIFNIADHVIENNGRKIDFYRKIHRIFKDFKN